MPARITQDGGSDASNILVRGRRIAAVACERRKYAELRGEANQA
jgi:hypothetical protein